MTSQVETVPVEMSLVEVIERFYHSDHRRFPVLEGNQLVGQISRRDVLQAAHGMISVAPNKEAALLYLSGLVERNEAPIG